MLIAKIIFTLSIIGIITFSILFYQSVEMSSIKQTLAEVIFYKNVDSGFYISYIFSYHNSTEFGDGILATIVDPNKNLTGINIDILFYRKKPEINWIESETAKNYPKAVKMVVISISGLVLCTTSVLYILFTYLIMKKIKNIKVTPV